MVDPMCAHGEPGKVETRFRWLIDQLEARLPVAGTEFSSRPPELVLLEALDALLKDMDRLKFNLLLPTQTQLAASQAREMQLREALASIEKSFAWIKAHVGVASNEALEGYSKCCVYETKDVLALPTDTTALEAMIIKAGEVMRERCVAAYTQETATWKAWPQAGAAERKGTGVIRALPAVTLDDLKSGAQDG